MAASKPFWLGVVLLIAAGLSDLSIVLIWLTWTESTDFIIAVAKTVQFLGFSLLFLGLGMAFLKQTAASNGLKHVLQTNKNIWVIVLSGLFLIVAAILFRFFYMFAGLL
jgi:hypothetical protein